MTVRSTSQPMSWSFKELAIIAVILTLTLSAHRARTHKKQLRSSQDEVAELSAQRDEALKKAKEAKEALRKVEQMYLDSKKRIADLKKDVNEQAKRAASAEQEVEALTRDLKQKSMQIVRAEQKAKELEKELKNLQAQIAGLKIEAKKTKDALGEIIREKEKEPKIRKEILNLKGDFGKVAILLDRSYSMETSGRWNEAVDVVSTWMTYLPMKECALITFGRDAEIYREGEQELFSLQDKKMGEENRKKLINYLKTIKPAGGTNTLKAFQLAYELESVDTIILFSDGAPNDGQSDKFDPAVATRIFDLCKAHPKVRVNSVGLGAYFDTQLGAFLLQLARLTGGNFLGR